MLNGVFKFDKLSILAASLCRNDPERPIKVELYKSSKSGNHELLGDTTLTLNHLQKEQITFDL